MDEIIPQGDRPAQLAQIYHPEAMIRGAQRLIEKLLRQTDNRLFNLYVDRRDPLFFAYQARNIDVLLPTGASHRIKSVVLLQNLIAKMESLNDDNVERRRICHGLSSVVNFLIPALQQTRCSRSIRAILPFSRRSSYRRRVFRLNIDAAQRDQGRANGEQDMEEVQLEFAPAVPFDSTRFSEDVKPNTGAASIPPVTDFRYNMFTHIFKSLNEQRLSGEFCDFTLKTSEISLPAHRSVLSACSPVFAAMMKYNSIESIKGVVDITDINGHIMSLVLDFIYRGQCDITVDNFTGVYASAEKYQIENLIDYCHDYIMSLLSPDNSLQMLEICQTFGMNLKIRSSVAKYVAENFDGVLVEDFCELSPDIVLLIASSMDKIHDDSDMRVKRKYNEAIFTGLCKWVEKDRNERGTYELEVLGCVDFTMLSKNFFKKNIEKIKSLENLPKCAKSLIQMLQTHYQNCFCPKCNGGGIPLSKNIRCTHCTKKLFRATGHCGHQTSSQYPLYECCYASIDANPVARQISHVIVNNTQTLTCEACSQINVLVAPSEQPVDSDASTVEFNE